MVMESVVERFTVRDELSFVAIELEKVELKFMVADALPIPGIVPCTERF
jgi:hypothetical protein